MRKVLSPEAKTARGEYMKALSAVQHLDSSTAESRGTKEYVTKMEALQQARRKYHGLRG